MRPRRLNGWVSGWLMALLVLLTGCATTGQSGLAGEERSATSKIDPWENYNRKVYAFNERIDRQILAPVARTYVNVVPQPVRRGVTNFFGNVSDVWSALNNFLQFKLADGMQDIVRVGTNTLFGLGGIFDVASELGVDRQGEDFGQTLGRWGMAPGPYVVWPVLGSSTLRDSLALPLDAQVSPALAVHNEWGKATVTGLQLVNTRANLLGASNMLNDIAFDKYIFVRDAYLQRRRSLVFDGDPPDEDDPPEAPVANQPAPPAAAPAASSSGQ